MKLVLTFEALTNIENIYRFYAIHSEIMAVKVSNEIFDEINLLSQFPTIGKIEPLLINREKEYRSLILLKGKFKLIYYIDQNILYIASLWDCRQNPEGIIKRLQ